MKASDAVQTLESNLAHIIKIANEIEHDKYVLETDECVPDTRFTKKAMIEIRNAIQALKETGA